MPSQPVDVIERSSRWAAQRWPLDAVIGLVGPEWDQGRVAYYAAACGQDSQVDFAAVRPRIRKYDVIGYSIFNDGSVRTSRRRLRSGPSERTSIAPEPSGRFSSRLTRFLPAAPDLRLERDPQLFMKAGDVCEVAIEGIGLLRTRSSMNHRPVTPYFRYAI